MCHRLSLLRLNISNPAPPTGFHFINTLLTGGLRTPPGVFLNSLRDLSAQRRHMETATCQRDVIVLGKESTKTRKVCLRGGNLMGFF